VSLWQERILAEAGAALRDHPDWSDTKIAGLVGTTPRPDRDRMVQFNHDGTETILPPHVVDEYGRRRPMTDEEFRLDVFDMIRTARELTTREGPGWVEECRAGTERAEREARKMIRDHLASGECFHDHDEDGPDAG
jgi:hypothetical protein